VAQPIPQPNHLLASLPRRDLAVLLPHLSVIDLPQSTVLFEMGQPIKLIYFPHSGVVSLVVPLASGEMIETAMVGRDGVAGGASVLSSNIALQKAVMQIAGVASVLKAERLRNLAKDSEVVRATLNMHEQLILVQAQQSAACNATHEVEARLCRWLLRCRDLLGSDELNLTQEYLAQMLGVRRGSVSGVARTLQRANLLQYVHGRIRIIDHDGLRDAACECYETVKSHSVRLLGSRRAP
jgi:CRP-like cAMP-binding protein